MYKGPSSAAIILMRWVSVVFVTLVPPQLSLAQHSACIPTEDLLERPPNADAKACDLAGQIWLLSSRNELDDLRALQMLVISRDAPPELLGFLLFQSGFALLDRQIMKGDEEIDAEIKWIFDTALFDIVGYGESEGYRQTALVAGRSLDEHYFDLPSTKGFWEAVFLGLDGGFEENRLATICLFRNWIPGQDRDAVIASTVVQSCFARRYYLP